MIFENLIYIPQCLAKPNRTKLQKRKSGKSTNLKMLRQRLQSDLEYYMKLYFRPNESFFYFDNENGSYLGGFKNWLIENSIVAMAKPETKKVITATNKRMLNLASPQSHVRWCIRWKVWFRNPPRYQQGRNLIGMWQW